MKITKKLAAAFVLAAIAGCTTCPVYKVNATAATPGAENLARGIAFDVNGGLLAKGYPMLAPGARLKSGQRLVAIDLEVERRETASPGDWRTHEGVVRASVTDGGKPAGAAEFRAGGERADNETDAERGVREALAKRVGEWVGGVSVPETK